MSHFFLLGLFAALFTQSSSFLDFSSKNSSMAWNFKERRLERQQLREERRLERQLKRQQFFSNSFPYLPQLIRFKAFLITVLSVLMFFTSQIHRLTENFH